MTMNGWIDGVPVLIDNFSVDTLAGPPMQRTLQVDIFIPSVVMAGNDFCDPFGNMLKVELFCHSFTNGKDHSVEISGNVFFVYVTGIEQLYNVRGDGLTLRLRAEAMMTVIPMKSNTSSSGGQVVNITGGNYTTTYPIYDDYKTSGGSATSWR